MTHSTPTNQSEAIGKLLYPVYNYGWPDTGMPGTQAQMSPVELKAGIEALIRQEVLDVLGRLEDSVQILEGTSQVGVIRRAITAEKTRYQVGEES